MLSSLILTFLSCAPKIYLSEHDLQYYLVNWRASEMTLLTPKMYPSPNMIYSVPPGELEGLSEYDVDDSEDVPQSEYDLQYYLVNWRASEMTLMTPKMYPSPHMIYSFTW
jgi:hypothetical protein